jgi:alpha-galactosidase
MFSAILHSTIYFCIQFSYRAIEHCGTMRSMSRSAFVLSRQGFALFVSAVPAFASAAQFGSAQFTQARAAVVTVDPTADTRCLALERHWSGPVLNTTLRNLCDAPIAISEVVALQGPHDLPPQTVLYGEGFTMLSLAVGTLGAPENLGRLDAVHYKIAQPEGSQTYYGAVLLSPPGAGHLLIGFLSARRYLGSVNLWPERFRVVFDTERLSIAPGQTWTFEPVYVGSGAARGALLDDFARRIAAANEARANSPVHTGWSSWNAFRKDVTFEQVIATTRIVAERAPMLDYIQLDDGFQPFEGDWQQTRAGFGGTIAQLSSAIRALGKKPALWVAPLVADRDSALLREHPDWFIQGADGKPLSADAVSFGGWGGPWYSLDGSNPAVQAHLEKQFRTMRRDWNIDYFKLDALFWGALQGGRLHDPNATRISAYRAAIAAIRRGAGNDTFITIANAPLWPSIGFADASRASNDVGYTWRSFRVVGRENLYRSWMHRRLWVTDPDSIMLWGQAPPKIGEPAEPAASANELRAHWTSIYMTGGIFLTGDDLTALPAERLEVLQQLGRPEGFAPRFDNPDLSFIDTARGPKAAFNWSDTARTVTLSGPPGSRWEDHWTGQLLRFDDGGHASVRVPGRDAMLLRRIP